MKYPLDKICIKSGAFCPSCQRKIEANLVAEDDLLVLKALVALEDKLKFLRKGEYVKSISLDDEIFVLLKDGFEGEELLTLEREISSAVGKKVKVVEQTNDLKRLVEQIIAPASLLGINKVWLPNGEEVLTVRVSKRDRRYLVKLKEQYESLIEKISGAKSKITFE
ncbi:MAG: transcription elongation factor [Desulfurococcaceae archaeon]